jgi:polyhydroxyalkanoate synthesis regulator phasin
VSGHIPYPHIVSWTDTPGEGEFMDADRDQAGQDQTESRRRDRLVERLDLMVESGRVTQSEADRLRAAAGQGEFDEVATGIRARHAGRKLDEAVEGGHMTREEADAYLERMKKGEHIPGLRAQLRKLLPGTGD